MAITPHPRADYAFLFRRIATFLGIADPNSPEGDQIQDGAPFTGSMVKNQIVQSDVETCSLIASVENHSFRSAFFTEDPDPIADGARVPAFIGTHGGVLIETGTASGVYDKGRLAGSFDALRRVRSSFAFYGSPYDLYFIDNDTLHTAGGQRGKVLVPTIPIADATVETPELSTPRAYQNGVIGHAIATLRPVGANAQHRMDWERIWSGYVSMILSNEASLPDPEKMQRIAA